MGSIPSTPIRKEAKMKTVCAWCQKVMKEDEGEEESHGVCKTCGKKVEEEIEALLISRGKSPEEIETLRKED